MSRIGKQSIPIPAGVEVSITPHSVSVKGPKGNIAMSVPHRIAVRKEGENIIVAPTLETKQSKKSWGTVRAIIANMIEGVIKGFEKRLEIEGVGYRATLQGKNLQLMLGFSHPINFESSPGVEFMVEKNAIIVSGISKEEVGRVAASIRALKKPEPYKGKGIRYAGEIIRRKAGKKAVTAG